MNKENKGISEFFERMEQLLDRLESLAHVKDVAKIGEGELNLLFESLQTALEELRVTEEELRQQNEEVVAAHEIAEEERRRYQSLFDFTPDGYVITDIAGYIREMNLSMMDLLNSTPRGAQRPLVVFVAREEHSKFYFSLKNAVNLSHPEKFELRMQPREKPPFDAEVTVEPFRNMQGKPVGIRWMFHDITERQRTKAGRLAAEQALDQAEPLVQIGRMVSVVAHEIRNPLQNIRMGVELIRMVIGDDPDKQEILGEIDHGVNLLNTTVEELLEYARPVKVYKRFWAIGEICHQALRGTSHLLNDFAVSAPCTLEKTSIEVDGQKIIQVLINLITNAIEAMPEGGELKLEADFSESDGNRFAKISVSDTGSGIPEDKLLEMQQPFVTTKLHGTGLGLPICRKIVEAHGGTLDICSKVSQGTTVEVVLPVETTR